MFDLLLSQNHILVGKPGFLKLVHHQLISMTSASVLWQPMQGNFLLLFIFT